MQYLLILCVGGLCFGEQYGHIFAFVTACPVENKRIYIGHTKITDEWVKYAF